MAIIGNPERVWELPAPLDIPQDFPLETHEIEREIEVETVIPEKETIEV